MEMRPEDLIQNAAPTIRSRGYSYFLAGNVSYITEVEPGEWRAVVEGSVAYALESELDRRD